jgi:hypothetical protein
MSKISSELLLMSSFRPSCWRRCSLPPNILQQPVVTTHSSLSPGLYVGPVAHVLVLLLHPEQLSIAVLVSYLGGWKELFEYNVVLIIYIIYSPSS